MAIVIALECDGCRSKRHLTETQRGMLERNSLEWRRIPVNTKLGPARDEQPVLCPGCQELVLQFIQTGIPRR